MTREPLSKRAVGKWPAVLAAIGVDPKFLVNRHGPCPLCEGGKDRFRFDDKDGRGTWFCNQCGAGDGIELVKRFLRVEFKEAAPEIEKHLGAAPVHAVRQGPRPCDVKAEMLAVWKEARPLDAVPASALWWAKRCGDVAPDCADLRSHHALRLANVGTFPAMLAKVRDSAGHWINLHRTFLAPHGDKAAIDEPRRVMPLQLPKGCAVRLSEPGPFLGVAEGIETAWAAHLIHDVPVWATLTANNMRGFEPPPGTKRLVIFGDLDLNFTGQAAAFGLARALWAKRKQWDPELQVVVEIPGLSVDSSMIGDDWRDVLMARNAPRSQVAA